MRLDRFLAECGLGTRSEVKKIIKKKQITVNGMIASEPQQKVEENGDVICFRGEPLCYAKFRYYLFHKPAGCVTAVSDTVHKTVMDYFPKEKRRGLAPVGRLDLDTEGLLLVTDDGALAHHLLSPAHHVPKTYYVRLDIPVPESAQELFANGVDIGDEKPTLPAQLTHLSEKEAKLTITEGRFHQVKRMFSAVGCEVVYLKRLTMGSLSLEELPIGTYRELTADEITRLQNDGE